MLGLRSLVVEVVSRTVLTSNELLSAFAERHNLPDPTKPGGLERWQAHLVGGGGGYSSQNNSAARQGAPPIRTFAGGGGANANASAGGVATTFVDAFDNSVNAPGGAFGGGAAAAGPHGPEGEARKLARIAESMCGLRGLSPVPIADRKWRARAYANCWVGREAVQWLVAAGIAESPRQAVAIGTRMMKAHIVAKVGDSTVAFFHDSMLFYKFAHPEFKWPLTVLTPRRDTQVRTAAARAGGGIHQAAAVAAATAGSNGGGGGASGGTSGDDQERRLWLLLEAEMRRIQERLGSSWPDMAKILHDMVATNNAKFERQVAAKSSYSAGSGTGPHSPPATTINAPHSSSSSSSSSSSLQSPSMGGHASSASTSASGSASSALPRLGSGDLHACLRRTGHFLGGDLIRFLKKHKYARSTRDAMVLATWLLKLPDQAAHQLPYGVDAFFMVVGRDGLLSPEVKKHVLRLGAMLETHAPAHGHGHGQHQHQQQGQAGHAHPHGHGHGHTGSGSPRGVAGGPGSVSPRTAGGQLSPRSNGAVDHVHRMDAGLVRIPSVLDGVGGGVGGAKLSPTGPSGSSGPPPPAADPSLIQPLARRSQGSGVSFIPTNGGEILLPIKESPRPSSGGGSATNAQGGVGGGGGGGGGLLPLEVALLSHGAYHSFLSSVEHIASVPFEHRDVFKNGDVWYKLCAPAPVSAAEAARAQMQLQLEQQQASLPGMAAEAHPTLPASASASSPGGVGGVGLGGSSAASASAAAASGPLPVPALSIPSLPLGSLGADAYFDSGMPSILRQQYHQYAKHTAALAGLPVTPGPGLGMAGGGASLGAYAAAFDPSILACHSEWNWEFVQSFGDDNSNYEDDDDADDLVTAVEFCASGEYLAIGDKAGRVSIVQENRHRTASAPLEYKFFTELQSHAPTFDCLKSIEIEPRINVIEWWREGGPQMALLTANDKTVKLWRVGKRPPSVKKSFESFVRGEEMGQGAGAGAGGMGGGMGFGNMQQQQQQQQYRQHSHGSMPPDLDEMEDDGGGGGCSGDNYEEQASISASAVSTYANAHGYCLHSVSTSSDCVTFLSADELRINLWDASRTDECFTVIDLKPPGDGMINELITVARFHPRDCHVLLHGSSRGVVRIADMRSHSVLDRSASATLGTTNPPGVFNEIINSVLDARFSRDGRYVLCRDYMTLRMWDTHNPSTPVHTAQVHPHLHAHLQHVLDNEAIFDQFQADMSADGLHFVSGTYSNSFTLHNWMTHRTVTIKARDDLREPLVINEHYTHAGGDARADPPALSLHPNRRGLEGRFGNSAAAMAAAIANAGGLRLQHPAPGSGAAPLGSNPAAHFNQLKPGRPPNYRRKILKVAWHPQMNAVAVAGLYKLYLYQAKAPTLQL